MVAVLEHHEMVEIFGQSTPCSGGSRPLDKGGGAGHPDPEIRGGGRS